MNSLTNTVLTELYSKANSKNAEGMKRYGITSTKKVLGVSAKPLFAMAKRLGKNTDLAIELWKTGVYEARILSTLIADPNKIKKSTMNAWIKDFDNWAVCDCACMHCFRDTPYAHELAVTWVKRKQEFVRRAGFSMIATLCVHDKKMNDKVFIKYLPLVKKYAADERQYVKKAVNWALRQIGKRSLYCNPYAVKAAKEIKKMNSPSAKWIASDALRELQSPAVKKRLKTWAKRSKK
ncbi:MAG: DNA alkylation repair protein [Bacteroidetes bacterium]|nr:DNA alkylation repair protein [Bacteroidota bacterium]